MIVDASLILANNQAITASAKSTETLDMGAMGTTAYGPSRVTLQQHLGRGICVPLLIQVTDDFAGLTSLTVQIRQSTAAAMTSPVILLSQEVPVAKLKAGFKFNIDKLPAEVTQRYVDLNFVVTGGPATDGTIFAGFVSAVDDAYDGNTH